MAKRAPSPLATVGALCGARTNPTAGCCCCLCGAYVWCACMVATQPLVPCTCCLDRRLCVPADGSRVITYLGPACPVHRHHIARPRWSTVASPAGRRRRIRQGLRPVSLSQEYIHAGWLWTLPALSPLGPCSLTPPPSSPRVHDVHDLETRRERVEGIADGVSSLWLQRSGAIAARTQQQQLPPAGAESAASTFRRRRGARPGAVGPVRLGAGAAGRAEAADCGRPLAASCGRPPAPACRRGTAHAVPLGEHVLGRAAHTHAGGGATRLCLFCCVGGLRCARRSGGLPLALRGSGNRVVEARRNCR